MTLHEPLAWKQSEIVRDVLIEVTKNNGLRPKGMMISRVPGEQQCIFGASHSHYKPTESIHIFQNRFLP